MKIASPLFFFFSEGNVAVLVLPLPSAEKPPSSQGCCRGTEQTSLLQGAQRNTGESTSQPPVRAVIYLLKRPNKRGWWRFVSRRSDAGIYAAKCWRVMEKLRSRNKNKREKINSCLCSPSPPSWRRLWSKQARFLQIGSVLFFGFCFF